MSLRTDFASGDRDPANPELQSFNPLFPGNSYSGAVGLFGPTNLTDLTAAVTFAPRSNLTIGFEAPATGARQLGTAYATDLGCWSRRLSGRARRRAPTPSVPSPGWQPTRHLQLQGVITRFISGSFLEDLFASSSSASIPALSSIGFDRCSMTIGVTEIQARLTWTATPLKAMPLQGTDDRARSGCR